MKNFKEAQLDQSKTKTTKGGRSVTFIRRRRRPRPVICLTPIYGPTGPTTSIYGPMGPTGN